MKNPAKSEITASDIAIALEMIRASREKAIAAIKAQKAEPVNNKQK